MLMPKKSPLLNYSQQPIATPNKPYKLFKMNAKEVLAQVPEIQEDAEVNSRNHSSKPCTDFRKQEKKDGDSGVDFELDALSSRRELPELPRQKSCVEKGSKQLLVQQRNRGLTDYN